MLNYSFCISKFVCTILQLNFKRMQERMLNDCFFRLGLIFQMIKYLTDKYNYKLNKRSQNLPKTYWDQTINQIHPDKKLESYFRKLSEQHNQLIKYFRIKGKQHLILLPINIKEFLTLTVTNRCNMFTLPLIYCKTPRCTAKLRTWFKYNKNKQVKTMQYPKTLNRGHQPSIFSQQSFSDNRFQQVQSYEIQQHMEMMLSANQLLQEIIKKNSSQIHQLLNINITIVEQIMKNKLVRSLRGEGMMLLVICQLIILIKENTLELKRPKQELRKIKSQRQNIKNDDDLNFNYNIKEVFDQIDVMRRTISFGDISKPCNLQNALDKIQKKLNNFFAQKFSLQKLKLQSQNIIAQERAIRQLLEQQIEDYEQQIKQLKERCDVDLYQKVGQMQELKGQLEELRGKETLLRNQLLKKQEQEIDVILGSDILPMLLIQGISLQKIISDS